MKKYLKIIGINILVLLLLLSLVELYCYKVLVDKNKVVLEDFNKLSEANHGEKTYIKYMKSTDFNYENEKAGMRKPVLKESKKKPIVLFGCSFTYGYGLAENQIFSHKLANLTNRSVYNRAVPGTGTALMYYQLNDTDFKKEIPDAEYIIYTFIPDHFNRLFLNRMTDFDPRLMLRYEIKNGKLERVKPKFLLTESLFSSLIIHSKIDENKNKDINAQSELFKKIMMESLKASKEKYPNSKFVILIYKDRTCFENPAVNNRVEEVKKLSKEGFIVYDLDDVLGHNFAADEYYAEDNYHPSEKAWDEIAPKVAARLGL